MINIESVTSSLQKDAASFCKKLCQKSPQQKIIKKPLYGQNKSLVYFKKNSGIRFQITHKPFCRYLLFSSIHELIANVPPVMHSVKMNFF